MNGPQMVAFAIIGWFVALSFICLYLDERDRRAAK